MNAGALRATSISPFRYEAFAKTAPDSERSLDHVGNNGNGFSAFEDLVRCRLSLAAVRSCKTSAAFWARSAASLSTLPETLS